MGSLFVAGLSHHTAPIEVRELLALDTDKVKQILEELSGSGALAEAMILATCNRVEVYGVAEVPGAARRAVFERLGSQRGCQVDALEPLLYTKTQEEAVLHAFRVAASLDSMVLGEPQILGQVKDAFALAQSTGTVGPVLHSLMSQAFGVAKKVRTETEVGRLAVSVSFAAVELARKIFGSLDGKAVLLLGAGEMSELAARHLVDQGAQPVYVVNRTWSRAQELARTFSGIAVRFEDFEAALAVVDIVIASTAAPEPLVRAAAVREVLRQRRERPLFFVDIAVPRNVEPAVNELANAFCYDIDDLQSVVEANLRERQREAHRALGIVEREVDRFAQRLAELEVVPTIVSLREKLEAIRRAELERALGRLPAADEQTRRVMEALSQAIVNKVLHAPTVKLRDSSRAGHAPRLIEIVSDIFGLKGPGRREPGA